MKQAILIICTGYFGDVLLTSKLTRDIKKNYPDKKVVYICDTPYTSVAKNLPGVDEVFPYNRKINSNPINYLKFIFKFPYKNNILHTFIIHQNKNSRRTLAKHLGCKNFAITAWEDFKANDYHEKLVKENLKHKNVAYFNANMLSVLTNAKTDDKDIEFLIPEESQQKIDNFLNENKYKNLIALNPQAGDEEKCWGVEEFIKFTKTLINEGKTPVLTGVSKDGKKYVDALENEKDIEAKGYLNLIDKTNLSELGALYKRCEYVISVDTGSAHMACAVGAPTLTLFFKDNADLWAPINTKQNSHIYSSHISAEEVELRIKRYLKSS